MTLLKAYYEMLARQNHYLTCICCGRAAADVKPDFATICGVYEQVTGPMCADEKNCLKRKGEAV